MGNDLMNHLTVLQDMCRGLRLRLPFLGLYVLCSRFNLVQYTSQGCFHLVRNSQA